MTFPFCPAAPAATMFLQIGEARCDPKDGTNAWKAKLGSKTRTPDPIRRHPNPIEMSCTFVFKTHLTTEVV